MHTKSLSKLIILASSLTLLSGCGYTFTTPLTDDIKLTATFTASDKFTSPNGNNAIGEVTISEVVDGDTFHFYNGANVDPKTTRDLSYTVRFNGVNTPESTALVQPWGVKASQFVKSILWDSSTGKQKPYSVVLQNDIAAFGQTDNTTSQRYLAFVWYKMDENSDYRLLNLEIIEQCYSINYLSAYSDFCPYLTAFVEAARQGQISKKRVFGEKDPDYDYTEKIFDVTIREIKENYANYGVSDTDSLDSSGSGLKIRIVAMIIAFSGDSMFIRDVKDPDKDGRYAGIYVYTALTIPACASSYRPGQIISFVGRATKYHNNLQITDVYDKVTSVEDERIKIIVNPATYGIKNVDDWKDEEKYNSLKKAAEDLGYNYDLMPYEDDFSYIRSISDFESYVGDFVKVKLTVRNGDANDEKPTQDEKVDDIYRFDSDGENLTIFAKTESNVKLNLRIVSYTPGCYKKEKFSAGTTYYITGQIASYYDTYQIIVPNSKGYGTSYSPAYGTNGYVYVVNA